MLRDIWSKLFKKSYGAVEQEPPKHWVHDNEDLKSTAQRINYNGSQQVQDAMNTLKSIGLKDFCLFGGAIRDDLLGVPISDFDVICKISDISSFETVHYDDTSDRREAIEAVFDKIGVHDYQYEEDTYYMERYSVKIEGSSQKFDLLMYIDEEYAPWKRVFNAQDPLSSAILSSTGECFADPLFVNHLSKKALVYSPHTRPYRLEKLEKKTDELTFFADHETTDDLHTEIIATDNPTLPQIIPR